ncbi:MAG TPA: glycosyltransferase family 4 protein [Alphaproteobacteria bacterium]|nr:glycosyltransferase family 4 protein [Alphaproteobacteria bacterium]
MRVVILTQYYAPEIGAPQTRLAALARELIRHGHDVEVVTAMPHHLIGRVYDGYRRKFYLRDRVDGITVHRTWVYAATGTGLRRIANYLSFACTSLVGLARTARPDALFVESPPLFLSVPGWIAARARGARLIFNVADLWPDSVRELGVMRDGPALRAASWLEQWSYRRADVVNAVTEGIGRTLRERKGVPASKVRFLPNGIDVDMFYPRERDRELGRQLKLDERPTFLYAGTHGIAQGLRSVIEAAKLAESHATVVMVGSGPTKPWLIDLARRMKVTNVRFVDPVPLHAMPAYFSLASASIVPLVDKPLMHGARPSKIFPSLASGVPVLFCGRGESAELLERAGAGIRVEPERAQALADQMIALARNEPELARMAQCARALAVERFAWAPIVEGWLRSIEAQCPHAVSAKSKAPDRPEPWLRSARTSLTSEEPRPPG